MSLIKFHELFRVFSDYDIWENGNDLNGLRQMEITIDQWSNIKIEKFNTVNSNDGDGYANNNGNSTKRKQRGMNRNRNNGRNYRPY